LARLISKNDLKAFHIKIATILSVLFILVANYMIKSKLSLLIAITIAMLAVGWLISGQFANNSQPQKGHTENQKRSVSEELVTVRTRYLKAQPYTPHMRVTGQTERSRSVIIRTQATGKISKIIKKAGDSVNKGDVIAQLYSEDLPLRLKEARARVKQRELEFSAAKKLSQKGFKAETKYAAAFADLQAAKAFAERIRINLEYTNIHAPFSGVLSAQSAEIGDVLRKSDPVAELIDLDPLLITAYVSERDYLKIKMGQSAEVKLRNEKKINGRIQFISPVAQRDTRTFKVELETPNPRAQIPEGITAELILPLPETLAHQLSPSLFSLDENGNLGVKIINEEGRVQFKPIKIVGGSEDKTFVTGLPDPSNVIVVGQGFVMHGQIVKAVAETASSGKQS